MSETSGKRWRDRVDGRPARATREKVLTQSRGVLQHGCMNHDGERPADNLSLPTLSVRDGVERLG